MANITWAKHAVLEAAVRELEWEDRRNRATDPTKCPEKRGVSEGARPHSRSHAREATYPAPNTLERRHEPPPQQVGRARRARPQGTSAPGSATTPAAGTHGPVTRSDRRPSTDRRERALTDWRDSESIRAEFEAREAAGAPVEAPRRDESLRSSAPIMRAPDAVVKHLITKSYSAEIAGGVGCDHVTQT
jgi:hypothetical protein